jgi:hypothetical protein
MKPWWKSRTIWLNILATAAPLLQPVFSLSTYASLLVLIAVANVILRYDTEQPIGK